MSISHRTEPNAVKRIARDPVSRRKFFALTGGTGAAGALLAACGSDDETSTSSSTMSSGAENPALIRPRSLVPAARPERASSVVIVRTALQSWIACS